MLLPVIQEEKTGCAIASTAVLAGVSYQEARKMANSMGIFAEDKALWSETNYIRKLLKSFNVNTDKNETPFVNWEQLPDCALLAINWHIEKGKAYWHWVVFVRENIEKAVLDSSSRLQNNVRKDFNDIKPKWYIGINKKDTHNTPAQR